MNKCLSCERKFPPIGGEIEAGGFMLCRGCGHVMVWTKELMLRELTQKEYAEAGTHAALMRERSKVLPKRDTVQYKGSAMLVLTFVIIIAMVVAERTKLIKPIHEPTERMYNGHR